MSIIFNKNISEINLNDLYPKIEQKETDIPLKDFLLQKDNIELDIKLKKEINEILLELKD